MDGASPTVPAIDLSNSGIDLHSSHDFRAEMSYDGTTLAVTILDTQTQATATQSYKVDIPGTVGESAALCRFHRGHGGADLNPGDCELAGPTALAGNLISGNTVGVALGGATTGTVIQSGSGRMSRPLDHCRTRPTGCSSTLRTRRMSGSGRRAGQTRLRLTAKPVFMYLVALVIPSGGTRFTTTLANPSWWDPAQIEISRRHSFPVPSTHRMEHADRGTPGFRGKFDVFPSTSMPAPQAV